MCVDSAMRFKAVLGVESIDGLHRTPHAHSPGQAGNFGKFACHISSILVLGVSRPAIYPVTPRV